jgi:hypothetical protein
MEYSEACARKQLIVGLLDRSGSMRGREDDTIGGWNSMIDQIRIDKGNDIIICDLYLFDHELNEIYTEKNLDEITDLLKSDFIPRGQTAIDDSLGITLRRVIDNKENNSSVFDSCVIALSTDGHENASKQYTCAHVKDLIKQAEQLNITVLYLAAGQDAIEAAANRGISADQALNFNVEDSQASQAAYAAVGRVTSSYRSNPQNRVAFTQPERQASEPVRGNNATHFNTLQVPSTSRLMRSRSHHSNQIQPPRVRRSSIEVFSHP